jgi:hemolysin activation/secretion protein
MFSNKQIFATLSSVLIFLDPAYGATINPLTAPAPNTILAPPEPSPALPKPTTPELRENLGLPKGEKKLLKFKIKNVRIVGAKSIDSKLIAREFNPLLNKPITAEGLQAALDRVNSVYKDAGFALGRAFIPVQMMQNDTLIVRIVEGYIGKITINGENKRARDIVARFGQRLIEEAPLRTATLERFLLLMSDIPGAKVIGQFSDMDIYSGSATLTLNVEQDTFNVTTALDNRSNLNDMPFQVYLIGSINNALGNGEQLSLTTLATTQFQEQQYYRLAYSTFLGSDGTTITAGASYAKSSQDDILPGFDYISRSRGFDISARYPFIRALKENFYGDGGFYYSNTDNSLNNFEISEDAVRAIFADANYSALLDEKTTFGISIRITQGLNILSAGPEGKLHSRVGAEPNFFKTRAQAKLSYALLEQLTLSASVDGQYSPDSLYASEEIAFGGAHFGRGFDTSEVSGDSGYGTSLQAQYRIHTAALGGWTLLPYTFVDQSRVINHSVDGQGNDRLVSTGVGVTVSNQTWLAVGLEIDKPLNRDVNSRGDRDPRLFVSFEARL